MDYITTYMVKVGDRGVIEHNDYIFFWGKRRKINACIPPWTKGEMTWQDSCDVG